MAYGDIIKRAAQESGTPQKTVREVISRYLAETKKTLEKDGHVRIHNFGILKRTEHAAREVRNPQNGEKIFVPSQYAVNFSPLKKTRTFLDRSL